MWGGEQPGRRCSSSTRSTGVLTACSAGAGIGSGLALLSVLCGRLLAPRFRDCWAQSPLQRPSFDDTVARLRLAMDLASPLHSLERSTHS